MTVQMCIVDCSLSVLICGYGVCLEVQKDPCHNQVVSLSSYYQGCLLHLIVGMSQEPVFYQRFFDFLHIPLLHIHKELVGAGARIRFASWPDVSKVFIDLRGKPIASNVFHYSKNLLPKVVSDQFPSLVFWTQYFIIVVFIKLRQRRAYFLLLLLRVDKRCSSIHLMSSRRHNILFRNFLFVFYDILIDLVLHFLDFHSIFVGSLALSIFYLRILFLLPVFLS